MDLRQVGESLAGIDWWLCRQPPRGPCSGLPHDWAFRGLRHGISRQVL